MDRAPGGGARGRPRRGRLDPRAPRRRRRRAAATGCGTSRSCTAPTRRAARSRRRSCATGCATSWSAARASTSAARSRTRWPTCARCARTRTWRRSSGSSTCPPRGIGEQTIAGAARAGRRPRGGNVWAGARGAGCRRRASSPRAPRTRSAAFVAIIGRLRARVGAAGAARAAGPGAGGVGLPRDAAGRLAGGRGPLGQPARAARGGRALRRPGARGRPRPAAGGDRAGRRPGRLQGGRRRGDADHAARRQGPRVRRRSSSRAWRRASSRTARALDDPRQMEEERRLAYVGPDARAPPAVPDPRCAARHLGPGRFLGPVALPAGDPGRADARSAARRARTSRRRPATRATSATAGYDMDAHPRAARRHADGWSGGAAGAAVGTARPAAGRRLHCHPAAADDVRAGRRAAARRGVPAVARPGARREAYYGAPADPRAPTPTARRRSLAARAGGRSAQLGVVPPRPIVPGERRYRDGDRVRHAAFGRARVVTSKLTRDDEEVTVAFPERASRSCWPASPTWSCSASGVSGGRTSARRTALSLDRGARCSVTSGSVSGDAGLLGGPGNDRTTRMNRQETFRIDGSDLMGQGQAARRPGQQAPRGGAQRRRQERLRHPADGRRRRRDHRVPGDGGRRHRGTRDDVIRSSSNRWQPEAANGALGHGRVLQARSRLRRPRPTTTDAAPYGGPTVNSAATSRRHSGAGQRRARLAPERHHGSDSSASSRRRGARTRSLRFSPTRIVDPNGEAASRPRHRRRRRR